MTNQEIKKESLKEMLMALAEHAYLVGRLDARNCDKNFDINQFDKNIEKIIEIIDMEEESVFEEMLLNDQGPQPQKIEEFQQMLDFGDIPVVEVAYIERIK